MLDDVQIFAKYFSSIDLSKYPTYFNSYSDTFKIQALNGELRNQERRNLHDAERFSAW